MKSIISLVLCGALLTAVAVPATFADQNSDTETANVSAQVVTAISITKDADLDFGDVVAGGSSGTVSLAADGARDASGGATLGNAGSTSAAAFSVAGEPNATYAITLPSSATLTRDGGSETMTVDTFVSNPNGSGTLNGSGAQSLSVGATLHVSSSQVSGAYAGTFDVTVAYN